MSDPLTLATIALTAAGGVSRAQEARNEGNTQAALAERQAVAARQDAARAATDQRRRTAAVLARQKVRYAKGGIVLSGSPLDLLADAAAEGELAAQDALHQGEAAAADLRLRGDIARRRGRTARRQGLLDTGTRLLGDLR